VDKKVVGIILLVAGAVLLFWGYQSSSSLGSQLKQAVDGTPTNKAMMLYIAGGVLSALGVFRLVK